MQKQDDHAGREIDVMRGVMHERQAEHQNGEF